jgi:hypothetical protein
MPPGTCPSGVKIAPGAVSVDVVPWTNRPPRLSLHPVASQYTGSLPPAGTAKDCVPQPTRDVVPPDTNEIVEKGWRDVGREATRTPLPEATAPAARAKAGDVNRWPVVVTNVLPSM